jgi:hypothetical protein
MKIRLLLGGSVHLGWKGSENISYISLAFTGEYRCKILKQFTFIFPLYLL